MSDWQAGDLAIRVRSKTIQCRTSVHTGRQAAPSIKVAATEVTRCGCLSLISDRGVAALAARYRKLSPPKGDRFDIEVIEAMIFGPAREKIS